MDRKQERAFEGFVAESGDALLRLATLLTSDTGLGEDVYQETLHRLAARWSRVANPRAFCRQVMQNIVIDQARLKRRQVPQIRLVDGHDDRDPRSADPALAVELRPVLLDALRTLTTDVYPAGIIVPGANLRPTRLKHKLVLTEIGKETTVIDTIDGSIVTYQELTSTSGSAPGPGWKPPTESPTEFSSGPGSAQTSAQLDALPTDPAKLRAELLKAGDEQGRIPHATDADVVYEQAANLLWDANLSTAVRAALYKVLAATPGVKVNANATDSSGRTAVEISFFEAAAGQEIETFENPATGATLESATVGPSGNYAEDLYQSITYTSTIPANPYKG